MEFNRRNIRLLLLIVAFAIALLAALLNLGVVAEALKVALRMVSFLLIGLCVAFILNTPMKLMETRLFAFFNRRFGKRWQRIRRPICLTMTVLLVSGLLFLVFFLLIPELGATITLVSEQFPKFVEDTNLWLSGLLDGYGRSLDSWNIPKIDWVKIGDAALEMLKRGASNFLTGTMTAATGIVSGVFNFVVGVVLALYILAQKEKLAGQVKRALYAYLPEKRVDRLLEIGDMANQIFCSFISGQFFESMILGFLCFVGMRVFGFSFAPAVSLLVGVTAFIPIFGALIGFLVGALMILIHQGFADAAWFMVFFLLLQQVEGNLIYPHVVGKSVMLSGLWVLTAVTLGGNLLGIVGMVISVPLCSLFYALLREAVNRRNQAREVDLEKLKVREP